MESSYKVFEVMAVTVQSNNDVNAGLCPEIVLEPCVVVARDNKSAVAQALNKRAKGGTPITASNDWEWLVRPFV